MAGSSARPPVYDSIGSDYNRNRRADPRIAAKIAKLLGLPRCSTVADIGAGTGNYTNALADFGYRMIAIEPSATMRAQAKTYDRVEWRAGVAERIPLEDAAVDGVLATLAIHHFASLQDAAREMHRVCPTGPLVVYTADPRLGERCWFADYFPEIFQRDFDIFPPIEAVVEQLAAPGGRTATVEAFPLPRDLIDINMHAGWNRPEIYLDEQMRTNTSGFSLADPAVVERGLLRLRRDLESGRWDAENGDLRERAEYDLGFRFIRLTL